MMTPADAYVILLALVGLLALLAVLTRGDRDREDAWQRNHRNKAGDKW